MGERFSTDNRVTMVTGGKQVIRYNINPRPCTMEKEYAKIMKMGEIVRTRLIQGKTNVTEYTYLDADLGYGLTTISRGI